MPAGNRKWPDVIYALLNWQAAPFAHEVLMATPGIPFIWHFKLFMFDHHVPELVDLISFAE